MQHVPPTTNFTHPNVDIHGPCQHLRNNLPKHSAAPPVTHTPTALLNVYRDIKQFDPFEILGVEVDATERDIHRAYRKLSLVYHPDKNPNDQEAADKFMLVSKAHDALTNEEARKNFEEFGNPDGKQQMQVSIGLPSFFMSKDNHTPILIVYLLILVVMIPIGVGTYYASSIKYGDNDIMKATYDQIIRLFKPEDKFHPKMLPEIIGSAEEFAPLKYKKADIQALDKLYNKWVAQGSNDGRKLVLKPSVFVPPKVKGSEQLNANGKHMMKCFFHNVALTAHMMRSKLPENAQQIATTIVVRVSALHCTSFCMSICMHLPPHLLVEHFCFVFVVGVTNTFLLTEPL